MNRDYLILSEVLLSYGSEIHLHFVVHDQDKGSTSTSEDVGESTLEESLTTFVFQDLLEAINCTIVQEFLSTRLHHQSSSNSIEGIRNDTREGSDGLGNDELEENGGLGVRQESSLGGIVTTEVASSVGDDTNDGDTESLIKTLNTINSSNLVDTVNKTGELSIRSISSDISSKSSSGEIEGIDEHQRSGTSSTTGGEVTEEEFPEILLGVIGAEDLLVGILEGEVEGLSGEISDNVSEITSPESRDTFFLGDSEEDINDTLVLLVFRDMGVGSLSLEEELDSFDGSDSSLGDSSGDTTENEIEGEITGFDFRSFTHICD